MVLRCSGVRDWSILDFQLQVADVMKERKYSAVKQPQALMKCGTLISELWNYIIPVDLRFEIKDLAEDKRQSLLWNVCLLHTSPVAEFVFMQLSLGSISFFKKTSTHELLCTFVQEMSILLLHETGQRSENKRQIAMHSQRWTVWSDKTPLKKIQVIYALSCS